MKYLFYFVPPQNVIIALGCCGVFTFTLMGDLGFFKALLVGSFFILLAGVNPLRTFLSKPLTEHAWALIGMKQHIPDMRDDFIARTIDFAMRNPSTVKKPLSDGDPMQLVAIKSLERTATKYGPHGTLMLQRLATVKKELGYGAEEKHL